MIEKLPARKWKLSNQLEEKDKRRKKYTTTFAAEVADYTANFEMS